jgi:hypothetical protein
VVIENPPPDENNPDDYKEFFSQFGVVVNICVVKRNSNLLLALEKGRTIRLNLNLLKRSHAQNVQGWKK